MARNRGSKGNKKQKAAARQTRDNPGRKDHSADNAPLSSKGQQHDENDSILVAPTLGANIGADSSVWAECIKHFLELKKELTKAPAPMPETGDAGYRLIFQRIRFHLGDIILLAIYFLIVFGALYTLITYLLSFTRVLAASCAPSTVFIPVTQNVTTTETVFYSAPSADLTTILLTTVAATTTVTAGQVSSGAAISSSFSAPYTFSIVDSSTEWEGGYSPTSGVQISVATSIVTLTPIDSTAADLTTRMTLASTSTVEKLTTITLPATTSTSYSLLSTISTTTRTSTRYVTYSLSEVPSRSAFSGISSAGWNATSMRPTQSTPPLPAVTTLTELHYYGSDNITTSTSTNRITTTLGAIITTTLLPPTTIVTVNVPGVPLSMTTVTAPPVTITYTVQNGPFALSTSVSFSSIQSSDVVGAATTMTAINSTSPASSASQPGLPSSPMSQPHSSFSATQGSASHLDTTVTSSSKSIPTSSGVIVEPATTATQGGSGLTTTTVSADGLPTQLSAPTIFTVTSFLSGSGTTLVLTTSPVVATPKSSLPSTAATSEPVANLSSGTSADSEIPVTSGPTVGSSASGTNAFTSSGLSLSIPRPSTDSSPFVSIPDSASISESSSLPLRSSTELQGPNSTVSASATALGSISPQSTSIPRTSSFSSFSTQTSNLIATSSSSSASQFPNGTLTRSTSETASSSKSISFIVTSATSMPTSGCGEQGNFTMDFDDLPTFHSDRAGKRNDRRQSNGTFNNGSDITRQPPLSLRPYHHLTFSNGFVYAPVPVAPFTPISQPNVAAFLADGTSMRTGGRPDGTGEISDGPTPDDVSAFWFDAFGGFLGCDNAGPDDCTMEVTGLHWDPIANDEAPAFTQKYSLPPCPAYRNCALTLITFPSTARRLSGLEVRAVRNGEPRRFFMDDMHMAWSNKTCDAGLLRQQAQ